MRFLSLFSGIEAASVAWGPLGWECVAVAEIEPFPSALLAHHYPDVPNLGDVSRITGEQIAALGPLDIVVGGSPCQDLSVAGKRAGIAGARSGLFHEQIRIFHAARDFGGARFMLWENVPGAFSSYSGRDFAAVVGAMAGCEFGVPAGGWKNSGVALGPAGLVEWCVLDAQFFGLAQRRARVFALLDTGDWRSRPPVLLEPESLRGDSPPRREAWESPAPCLSARTKGGGGLGTDFDCDGGLVTHSLRADGFDASEDGTGRGTPIVPVGFNARQDPDSWTDRTGPLDTDGGTQAVAFDLAQITHKTNRSRAEVGLPTGALCAQSNVHVAAATQVRRLTTRECERLQGFPDDYTAITVRGRLAADGPRYKALGNSFAVPVVAWIGKRIEQAVIQHLNIRRSEAAKRQGRVAA